MRSNMPKKMENEQGDAVVISGIAGRFPKSNNLTQFRENLMNKVDLINDDDRRWNTDHPDIPRRAGKINNIEKFDARFFGVHFKEAHSMDPMARMLLEHTYEAIIDAGVHPGKLRGTNTGVFIGSCYSDTEITWVYSDSPVNGLGLLGCSRSMMANRISLWFGFKGPSYAVDSACSSSLFALDHAYKAIRTGQCDAAIVGGCHLCLHPFVTQQYFLLGTLSPDGRCKVFDAEGNGYCRSEAVSTIYLQKSKDAKRIYAQVVHVKTNCDGYKEEGITYPSIKMQRILLEQCYEECKVSPSDLAFLEAHGTGTKVGDPVEVSAVEKVFCPGRNTPLRIGSVKSNLGHSEPDSGLCSIAKLADWLVLRGAKKLVLTSRKEIGTGYQRMRFHIWKNYGVKIVVVVGKDASIPEDCEAILKKATALGPVHAIFNLAVVLKDALFENQTVESFKEPFVAKARATEQLDKLSRTLCPQLKQFVVFSSVSCGRGTAGQTNYAMANSIMERICERRSAENLPGLAIQWGAIGDVGKAAEMGENYKELVTGGTLPQRIDSCLQELDGFLQQKSPIVSSMVIAKKTALTNGAEHIVDAIANIMGLKNMNSMCVHTPLPELGMDSIMAVEIKYTLEHEFNIFLTTSEIRHLNFAKLQDMSQRDSKKYENRKKSPQQLDDSASIFQLLNILTVEGMSKNVCVPLMTTAEDARQVFILPGIEGACTIFKAIAGKLKSANTACLQYGPSSLNTTSIDEMADYLIPYIKARSMDRKKFLLVGYSYGSIVSIELARRLENEGFTGRLVMLDGSPDYVKTFLSSLTTKSEDELQTFVFLKIMDAVASFAVSKLTTELFSCRDWEEKIAAFTRNMPKNNLLNFTPEDQNTLCLGIYRRIKALLDYDCSNLLPIKSPVTLVRTRASSILFDTEDYGLKRLTQNKMKIYYAEGDHITMLNDDICAAAINEELALNVIPGSK